MKRLLVSAVCIGLVVVSVFTLFGVRGDVARENITKRIDSMLGSMDVKRKEIEHSVSSMKEALLQLRKAKIKAQVKSDQIGRKLTKAESDIENCDDALGHMRNHVMSAETVQLAGREYNPSQLKELAQRILCQRTVCVDQLDGLRQAKQRLQKVVGTLERKRSDYESKLVAIQNQVSVIDSNRIALSAMQQAAQAMDGSDSNLSRNVTQLEEKVNDLYADVEAELIVQDAKWQEDESLQELNTVDSIVSALRPAEDVINQIDAILAESKIAEVQK